MQETQVQSLNWDDPLKKGIATHSSIIAWKIPQTEETGGLQFLQLQRVDRTEQLLVSSLFLAYKVFFFFVFTFDQLRKFRLCFLGLLYIMYISVLNEYFNMCV